MPRNRRKNREIRPSKPGPSAEPSEARWNRWAALLIPAVAIVLLIVAFHGVVEAGFVYDDQTQILQNTFIQGGSFWQSMKVDVWAFRGDKGESWSSYWRPLFVAWLHLNYRLFGFRPGGWHVALVVLHGVATLLVFLLLARMKVSLAVQAIVTWLFAVHPVHVQSVTWVSGAPDVLMTVFLLGSLLFFLSARETATPVRWAAAILLFAAALLSKESAIAFPLVIAGLEWLVDRSPWRVILRRTLPFLTLVLVYLGVRTSILGGLRELAPFAPSLGGVLLTLPMTLAFYLKQSLLPIELGPIYGLRPVTAGTIGLTNVVVPVLFLAIAGLIGWRLARHNRAVLAGLVWFFGFLGIALDIRMFLPELMVQDRYLYLPLFGLLLILAVALDTLKRPGFAIGIVLVLAMTALTIRYNRVWANEISLWEQGARVDPTSAIAWAHLGEAYRIGQQLTKARAATGKALAINPDMTVANISMGAIELREGRYADAERYLKRVLAVYPDYAAALEQLGLAYMQQKKFDEAIDLFREGARRMPYNRGRYGVNLAVLYRVSGRRVEARAELESLRKALASATDPDVLIAWWYLGELNREEGRTEEARTAFLQYLQATEAIRDNPRVDEVRQKIRGYGFG